MITAFGILIVYKFNDIFLPYFWDEMAGYMTGVIYMVDHGISLHPSSVPHQLSYGHPLLMHATMAGVARIFGCTVVVMHITTLVFTFLLALGTYLLAYTLTKNYTASVFAYLLLLAQPVLIAQSTQVLLEVFLAMHCVYAIYFYIRGKYYWACLFALFAVLTKETGLVLTIALILTVLFDQVTKSDWIRTRRLLLLYIVPLIVFAIFLLLQKQTYGWYLNPTNVGKSKLTLDSMLQKTWDYSIEFTFINQGRLVLTAILLLAGISYFRNLKKQGKKLSFNPDLVLPILFFLGFFLFSSIADTLERYFLLAIPFVVILFASGILYLGTIHRLAPMCILLMCIVANLLSINNRRRCSEADVSYRDMARTHKMIMDYVNSGRFSRDTIGFSFPLLYAPLDSRYGYFNEKHFIADTSFVKHASFFVYTSPGNFDWNPPDTQRLTEVVIFKSGCSSAMLYKKRH